MCPLTHVPPCQVSHNTANRFHTHTHHPACSSAVVPPHLEAWSLYDSQQMWYMRITTDGLVCQVLVELSPCHCHGVMIVFGATPVHLRGLHTPLFCFPALAASGLPASSTWPAQARQLPCFCWLCIPQLAEASLTSFLPSMQALRPACSFKSHCPNGMPLYLCHVHFWRYCSEELASFPAIQQHQLYRHQQFTVFSFRMRHAPSSAACA